MKIGLFTKDFNPVRGGLERYGYNLAHSLTELGHEVHIFCKHEIAAGSERMISHVWEGRRNFLSILASPKHSPLVKDGACDVWYALVPHFPVDVYRAGDGVHLHWLQLKYPFAPTRWIARWLPGKIKACALERKIYTSEEHCKAIIVNSHLVKKHIHQYYGTDPSRIHVVYNGVNQDVFQGEKRAERNGWLSLHDLNPNRRLFLFVANNWERKGLKTAILGAKKLLRKKEAYLVVVGKGKVQSWQPFLQHLGIESEVRFIAPTSEVVHWYCSADVLVLPTTYDPFANVCLESFACGTPVITTRENGSGELVEEGKNGYLLSHHTAFDEVEHFLDLLQDATLRKSLSEQSLATAKAYTIERNALETLAVLEKMRH